MQVNGKQWLWTNIDALRQAKNEFANVPISRSFGAGMNRFWECGDCSRLYDIDIDKCSECGGDDWREIFKAEYVSAMLSKLAKLVRK